MLEDQFEPWLPLMPDNTCLRAQSNVTRSVALANGSLISNAQSRTSGVSALAFDNGCTGFAAWPLISKEGIGTVLREAAGNASWLGARARKTAPPLPALPGGYRELPPCDENIPQKEYLDFAAALDAYIAGKYPDLNSRTVSVRSDSLEKRLAAKSGTSFYSHNPRCFAAIDLTVKTDDGAVVGIRDDQGGFGTLRDHFTDPSLLYAWIDTVVENLYLKAEGIYPEAGVHTVVLGSALAGILAHEAVGHTVEADLVMAGSVAARCLNEQVASELVTLIDYAATGPDGKPVPLPVVADDEGTPAEDAVIIRDGILRSYMNNRASAAHFGVKPQGNARAYSWLDEPLIRMRNTCILPGKDKLEDMIASIDSGYFFERNGNGQADMTGEFMFGVTLGREIKNGKLGRALRDTTISGLAFELLRSVDMLSDELNWVLNGTCGKKQPMPVGMGGPAVKCRIHVGGK